MPYEIFISHTHQDKELATALSALIESVLVVKPLQSSSVDRAISRGLILDGVRAGIEGCQEFILLLTPESVSSSWVFFESGAAWHAGKNITVIRVGSVDVPTWISHVKWIDLSDAVSTREAHKELEHYFNNDLATRVGRDARYKPARINSFLTKARNQQPKPSDTARELSEQNELDRLDRTFRFMARWESPPIALARDRSRKNISEEHGRPISAAEVEGDIDLRRSVTHMFNYFEEIYFAIKRKAIIEVIIADSLGGVFNQALKRFDPWLNLLEGDSGLQSDSRYVLKLRELGTMFDEILAEQALTRESGNHSN